MLVVDLVKTSECGPRFKPAFSGIRTMATFRSVMLHTDGEVRAELREEQQIVRLYLNHPLNHQNYMTQNLSSCYKVATALDLISIKIKIDLEPKI